MTKAGPGDGEGVRPYIVAYSDQITHPWGGVLPPSPLMSMDVRQ